MLNQLKQIVRENSRIEKLARKLTAAVPYKYRIGSHFFSWYALYLEAETWSTAEVMHYQQGLLKKLLDEVRQEQAFENYFADMTTEEIADRFTEIVPVMSREDFRARTAATRVSADKAGANKVSAKSAQSRRGRVTAASTSGTTGNALQFFHEAADNEREWAAICYQWRRIGYDPIRSRRAEFRGAVRPNCLVEVYPEYNMLRCSILDMSAHAVKYYAEQCRHHGIEYLHGYPSALHLLARTCQTENIHFPFIRGIMLASEMVYPHQLEAIETVFPRSKILAHYGNAERVALGAWCEHARSYHMLALYSKIEIDPVDQCLIGTNLFNRINPFLRYKVSDRLRSEGIQKCRHCGRDAYPMVSSIEGRAEDYLYSPVTGWIPPAIVTYPLKGLRAIREIQLHQKTPQQIELHYATDASSADTHVIDVYATDVRATDVRATDVRATDVQTLATEIDSVVAGLSKIIQGVEFTPLRKKSFEKNASGKFKWIVSELAQAENL